MKIEEFTLERIQSLYENTVEFNLSDSGVHPYSLNELLSAEQRAKLMEVELGWAVLVTLLALAGSIAYVAFELSRDARRVRSR